MLAEWFEDHHLELLNDPGIGTFFRTNMMAPSVIDLTLATSPITQQIEDWQVLPDLGSDHFGIIFNIKGDPSIFC